MRDAENSGTVIEVRGLVKTFGLRPVLRGLDLQIGRGECVALLGANGGGKTTLIRILAALSRPTRGEVRIGGWMLPDEAGQIRPHLGYLGHLPLLYNDLTALENLQFFGRLYRLTKPNLPAALDRVGLGKRGGDRVGSFSRGMQQRLGIARALIHDPDIVLFDEPYTGLDVDGAIMLDGVIRELAAVGKTVLLTSHDLDRTRTLSRRIVILSRGTVARDVFSDGVTSAELAGLYADAMRG